MASVSQDHARLIRQLETIAVLSDEDRAALAALPLRVKSIGENRDIIREGSKPTESCLVLEGLVCRYKMVAGGRRQILSFHLPGDLPDLASLYLPRMDHSIAALTPARVAFIPHEAIRNIIRKHVSLAETLTRHALIDGSIFREWIANVGRRTALERIAHVMCETYVRMRALGLVKLEAFDLPLTQAELGDATGLSNVHVNRTLQELRKLGVITTVKKVHTIVDWEMLKETADFDPAYLHLNSGNGARPPVN
jgi:CRP-like cAMP-binding protein